ATSFQSIRSISGIPLLRGWVGQSFCRPQYWETTNTVAGKRHSCNTGTACSKKFRKPSSNVSATAPGVSRTTLKGTTGVLDSARNAFCSGNSSGRIEMTDLDIHREWYVKRQERPRIIGPGRGKHPYHWAKETAVKNIAPRRSERKCRYIDETR